MKEEKDVVLEVTVANSQFFASVKILERRYDDCDKYKTHLLPSRSYCDHCYRRLNHKTPKANQLLSEYKDIHLDDIPRSVIKDFIDLRRVEIAQQQQQDFIDGIWKVKDQIYGRR